MMMMIIIIIIIYTSQDNVINNLLLCDLHTRQRFNKGVFIATQLNSTQLNWIQLNSTRRREQQLTQFVGRDVINENTLAVRCSTGSVEFSW